MMKALALLLLVLSCAACQDDNDVTGPTTDPVAITGRVIEFFSREPSRGATIEFRTTAGAPVTATLTDSAGNYSATLPRGGEYLIFINGNAGGTAYVGVSYRGDLMTHSGRCVARYGTVTDVTGRPVANATVSLGPLSAVTARDGWYAIEFGCPSTGVIGTDTILIDVAAEGFTSLARALGRGLAGVQRFDVALGKPRD